MAKFVKGDVVVLPFPFSDLSGNKRRPALVLCNLPGDDIILCQITSQNGNDIYSLTINPSDFKLGSLPVTSYIRPGRIFTADEKIIIRKAGTIKPATVNIVSQTLISLLS